MQNKINIKHCKYKFTKIEDLISKNKYQYNKFSLNPLIIIDKYKKTHTLPLNSV